MTNENENSGSSRVGPLDTVIILLIASTMTLFLVWLAGRVGRIQTLVQLPDFIVKGYGAVWSYLTGAAASTLLAFLRNKDDQRPNFLLCSLGTTVFFLVLVFGSAVGVHKMWGADTSKLNTSNWPDSMALVKVWIPPDPQSQAIISFEQESPKSRDPIPLSADKTDSSYPPNMRYDQYVEWPLSTVPVQVDIVRPPAVAHLTDQPQDPIAICFAGNPNPPTNSPKFEVHLQCSEAGKCAFTRDDPGWAAAAPCPKLKDNESVNNNLAVVNPPFLSLTPSAYAATPTDPGKAPGWSVPSLETLLLMPPNSRPGYTRFDLKSEALSGVENADSYRYEIFANQKPIYVDGWPPSNMVRTFNPAQGFDFPFALQNLDFSGPDQGCEKLQINLEFMSKHQPVKSLQLTREYAALRDAVPSEIQPASGMRFLWTGTYTRPALDDKVEVFVISPGSAGEASRRKQQIDDEHKSYEGMDVVGVVRPPLNAPPSYGVILGLHEPTGQIKFTFDYATAQKLKTWAMGAQVMKGIVPFLYETRSVDTGAGNIGTLRTKGRHVSACSDCFVIMGAAVKPGGQPSGAMQRRVEGAIEAGAHSTSPLYLVTGGKGKSGFVEADVMRSMLLQAGVPDTQILADPDSTDTLQSIFACTTMLRGKIKPQAVIVCSDRYHVPRCRWLFLMMGIVTVKRQMPSGLKANGLLRWTYYYVRETAAIVWDTFALIGHQALRALNGAGKSAQ